MNHYRPDGTLVQGYFCHTCGEPCGMFGHYQDCEPNSKLVKRLLGANPPSGVKPKFVRQGISGEGCK